MNPTIERIEKEFQNRLSVHLDYIFPKGKCKERGQALLFNAQAVILFGKFYRQQIKELLDSCPSEKKEPKNIHQTMYCRGWNRHCDEVLKWKGIK